MNDLTSSAESRVGDVRCGYCFADQPDVVAVVSTCPIHGPLRRASACQGCIADPAHRKGKHVHMVLACEEEVVLHEL